MSFDVRFGNDTVSGTGIRYNMNPTAISWGFQNLWDVSAKPGMPPTSGLDARLPAANYQGHEGISFNLQGIIDTSLNPGTILHDAAYNVSDGSVNVQINIGALGSLTVVGSGYLYHTPLIEFLKKHPQNMTNTWFDLGGSVSAIIQSVKIIPRLDSMKMYTKTNADATQNLTVGSEYLVNYSVEFMVISGPMTPGA